jgi:hypothetical protein
MEMALVKRTSVVLPHTLNCTWQFLELLCGFKANSLAVDDKTIMIVALSGIGKLMH